jgi:hypothetical protein
MLSCTGGSWTFFAKFRACGRIAFILYRSVSSFFPHDSEAEKKINVLLMRGKKFNWRCLSWPFYKVKLEVNPEFALGSSQTNEKRSGYATAVISISAFQLLHWSINWLIFCICLTVCLFSNPDAKLVAEESKPPPDKLKALAEARYQAVLKVVGCEILGNKYTSCSGLFRINIWKTFFL